jgi:hypothetical protein
MKRETLKYTDAKGLKIFAQTMINHKESHIHVVKTIVIAKMIDFYAVINTDTLKITPFGTEDDALDHVLDYYGSIDAQQSKLFNSSLHIVSKLFEFKDKEPNKGDHIGMVWEDGSDCECEYIGLDPTILPLPIKWYYVNAC